MALTQRGGKPAIVAAVIIAICASLYLSFGHIALYIFSKQHNMELAYKGMKRAGAVKFIFDDFKITAKDTGHAVRSRSARIVLMPKDLLFQNCEIKFQLTDSFFSKEGSETDQMYANLAGLVGAPFGSEWRYHDISGMIKTFRGGVEIKDFMAAADDIKLSAGGSVYDRGFIDLDMVIYFSAKLVGRMPEGLSKTFLAPEADGSSRLSVHVEGDCEMPSLQVTGKLFRLNIKNASQAGG